MDKPPDMIADFVDPKLIPLLVHLGLKEITPLVISSIDDLIEVEYVKGERLGNLLKKGEADLLKTIYKQLGVNVAYINKLLISHCDLHTHNIIINEGKPVIIDWGKAYPTIAVADSILSQDDSSCLLEDTNEILNKTGRQELYGILKQVYTDNYKEEIVKPLEKTPEQIRKEFYDKMFEIKAKKMVEQFEKERERFKNNELFRSFFE